MNFKFGNSTHLEIPTPHAMIFEISNLNSKNHGILKFQNEFGILEFVFQ